MSDAELIAEARKLIDGTTPGPWIKREDDIIRSSGGSFNGVPLASPWVDGAWEGDDATPESTANASFIAASRQLVPALLEALEAANTRIEALTAKLATCEKYRDAYDEMGRIGTQAVRDLEAKLAKAVEIGNKMAHSIEGNYYLPNIAGEWRKVAAEIKGESHE